MELLRPVSHDRRSSNEHNVTGIVAARKQKQTTHQNVDVISSSCAFYSVVDKVRGMCRDPSRVRRDETTLIRTSHVKYHLLN